MAEVATDFYPKPAQAPNALDTIARLGAVQNTMNQNQLFQAQFQARQAMGELLQGAIDKETGDIDYPKAITLLASDPRTAFMAPEFAKEALSRQATQADIVMKTLQTNEIRTRQQGQMAMSLAALGTEIKRADVIKGAGQLYADGYLDKAQYLELVANLPASGLKLHGLMKQLAIRGMALADSLGATFGELQTIQAGGETVVLQTPKMGGPTEVRARVEMTPTAQDRNELKRYYDDKSGTWKEAPRQDIAQMYSGTGRGLSTTNELGAAPPGQVADLRLPPAGSPAPRASASPGVTVEPNPMVKNMQGRIGDKLADYDDTLNADVATQVKLVKRLTEMQKQGELAEVGGGTQFRKTLAEFVQAIGSFAPDKYKQDFASMVDRIAKGDLSALQVFDKLGSQGAMEAVKAAMGSQNRIAVMEFETFLRTNPNLNSDPRAVESIFNFLRSSAQTKIDEQKEWRTWKKLNKQNPERFQLDDFQAYWTEKLISEGKIDPAVASGKMIGTEGGPVRGGGKAAPAAAPATEKPKRKLEDILK